MSERMTSIRLEGQSFGNGIAEWGSKTPDEMIKILKEYAAQNLAAAEAILAAPDSAFTVETYKGVHVRKDLKVLQKGVKP